MELTSSAGEGPVSRTLRDALKGLGAAVVSRSGMLKAYEWIGRGKLAILTLHRVVSDEERAESIHKPMMVTLGQFGQLLDAVSRWGRPVSLGDTVDRMVAGERIEAGSIALTFDDGYRDLYSRAFPMLKARGIPATVFLTTSAIDRSSGYLWWDDVDWFVRVCGQRADRLGKPESDDEAAVVERIRRVSAQRTPVAEASLRAALQRLTPAQRDRMVDEMRSVVGRDEMRPRLMLNWDEVRAMADLVEPANHTVDHPMLDRMSGTDLRRQIAEAKARIEQETGVPCRGLAYPSGAFSGDVLAAAADCGVRFAVTTRFHNNSARSDPLALGRKDAGYFFIDGRIDPDFFRFRLSGAADWLGKRQG
jgi:peptidoglycan/xylan/chitin deacetylase (PgdA/CDA1 family)